MCWGEKDPGTQLSAGLIQRDVCLCVKVKIKPCLKCEYSANSPRRGWSRGTAGCRWEQVGFCVLLRTRMLLFFPHQRTGGSMKARAWSVLTLKPRVNHSEHASRLKKKERKKKSKRFWEEFWSKPCPTIPFKEHFIRDHFYLDTCDLKCWIFQIWNSLTCR